MPVRKNNRLQQVLLFTVRPYISTFPSVSFNFFFNHSFMKNLPFVHAGKKNVIYAAKGSISLFNINGGNINYISHKAVMA